MADEELELDLGDEDITRKDNRIKSLSDKVKLTSQERDTIAKAKEEETLARANAEKERDFYKGFNPMTTKYPGSADFQEKILEKSKLGLDIEEATLLVMAKEGKYTPPPVKEEKESAAGGSATTGLPGGGSKSLSEMSREEKRAALVEAETRGDFKL